MQAISIGEVLWDIIGPAEHLGGAPFNFAAHLCNLDHDVFFVSAVGDDERGHAVVERMQQIGLPSRFVRKVPECPTGTASVALQGAGQPRFVINRPAAYDFTALSDQDWKDLLCPAPDLLYFGTLFQTSAQNRALTVKLLQTCTSSHKFYDVNLRPDSYTPALVGELLQHATIVKVNEDEAEAISDMFGSRIKSLEHFCRSYKDRFGWHTACVTRGAAGCVLLVGDTFVECNGYPVSVIDTVGAGDAFSAALAHGIVSGWEPSKIADFANRVGALIASRSGATPHWTFEEAAALTRPE